MGAFSGGSPSDVRAFRRLKRTTLQGNTLLRDLRLTLRTRSRYAAALRNFDRFCAMHRVELTPRDPLFCDYVAESFVQCLFKVGAPVSYGSTFLSALKSRFPSLRRQLVQAWQAQVAWKKLDFSFELLLL